MSPFEWYPLIITLALIASYLTLASRKYRQILFIIISVLGIAVASYAFFTQLLVPQTERGYFRALGLPIAVDVVIIICFILLTLERTFSEPSLKKWVFPGIGVYFIVLELSQIISVVGVSVRLEESVYMVPFWSGVCFLLLLFAFLSAVISRFSLKLFQIFLPMMFVSFLFHLAELYQVTVVANILGKGGSEYSSSPGPKALMDAFFLAGVYTLIQILSYMYISTKANAQNLKQNVLADKLPGTGILLVLASFFYQFPEYKILRELLPVRLEIVEHTLMSLDLFLVPVFLVISRWPYVRGKGLQLSLLTLGLVFIMIAGAAVYYYNPFRSKPSEEIEIRAANAIRVFSSWNAPALINLWKSEGRRSLEIKGNPEAFFQGYRDLLGVSIKHHNSQGIIYTLPTFPPGFLTVGTFSSDVIFQRGNATIYYVMVVREGKAFSRGFGIAVGSPIGY